MKKLYMILVCILLAGTITGCADTGGTTENHQTDEELSAAFEIEDPVLAESTGSIGFGFLEPQEDGYVYDGTEIVVPYYIENMGQENEADAEVGLMFFVDGEVQPCVVRSGEKTSNESTYHKFSLAPGERQEFEIVFHPIAGFEGEEIGMIPAVIWNSEYMPENEDAPRFGNCYSFSTNVVFPIKMEADGTNMHTASSQTYEITDIPEDIMLSLEGMYGNDTYDILDNSVGFEIETEDDKDVLWAENGKVTVTINLYGGKQVTDKITLFVGNQPVTVQDGDYVVVSTEKNKLCQIKTTLDVSELEENSVLYAIVMTSGEDFNIQNIYMTPPVLINIGK